MDALTLACTPGWAAWEQSRDFCCETSLQSRILARAALAITFAAAHPGVLVDQTLLLGLFQRRFLDEDSLPLVPLAGPAPPHDDSRQAAGLFGPAGERGIARREEYQVVQVGAAHAVWPGIVHDEQIPAVPAFGAGPVVHWLDYDQVRGLVLTLRDALPFGGRQIGGKPARSPGALGRRVAISGEAQLTAVPGSGNVLGLARLQAVGSGPALKAFECGSKLVVARLYEVSQESGPALPPVSHMAAMQPADADTHVDGRDVLLPGQRLLSGGHDPALKIR